MRPCDCKDMVTAMKLNEQGVNYNSYTLSLRPSTVTIEINPHVSIKLPQHIFKRFAEWYLDDQD